MSLLLGVAAFGASLQASESKSASVSVGPDGRVKAYTLETLELKGTKRTTAEAIARELDLKPGIPVDDELVMSTRQKLLSLGLFRSVLLFMRKGSKPGLARLIIEVEDDETVLGSWAIGGLAALTYGEPKAETASPDTPPLGYQLELVSRNFLGDLHRGSLFADIDAGGNLRAAKVAYGFPRFALEDVQFDAQAAVYDVSHRYLDAQGFGARGEAFWSQEVFNLSKFQYGVAMYLNRDEPYAMPSFPKTVAGPKLSYGKETRLISFFPQAGYQYNVSLLLSPGNTEDSVTELSGARTFAVRNFLWLTLQGKVLTVGSTGVSSRVEARIDIPFDKSDEDLAELFMRFRAGSDRYKDTQLVGSAAIFGLRYHSYGFIAELAFKITKTPREFEPLINRWEAQ